MIEIIAIHPDQLVHVWPALREGVDKCLKHSLGLFTEAQLYGAIAAGEYLLFAAVRDGAPAAAIVAHVREGEQRVLDVGYCWGRHVDEWVEPIYTALERIGRELGCSTMAFNGRPGWRKLARNMGFSINSMTFAKGI